MSQIRFTHTQARLKLKCTVSCGIRGTIFEITRILQWVRTIHETVKRIIDGESTVHDEIVFPDIAHIAETIFSGYKTLVIAALSFAAAIATGYAFFWTCGIQVFVAICRIFLLALRAVTFTVLKTLRLIVIALYRRVFSRSTASKNGHVKQL
ncbi:hypothetical protein RB195_008104 [Necator americanus]|uniref:ABC transmembrane type-1 domain-containing protein n=1 Tax=Necator americanus TaxID=51031 RepID=A0ABR1CM14_NECAM